MTEPPVVVRLATPADQEPLYDLLVGLWLDSPIAQIIPYRRERVIEQIRAGTERQGGLIGVVDSSNGFRIDGSIGLFLQQWWWADYYFLNAMWCFVRPEERRGGRIGDALFRFALEARQQMATQLGPDHPFIIEMSHVQGERLAARDRWWSRYARRIGSVFIAGP